MGHTSCYNLVKHVETHFKNLYIIFSTILFFLKAIIIIAK